MSHPGNLQRMQIFRRPQIFNGRNLGMIRHSAHFRDTGPDRFSIHDHSTGAALTGSATDLATRQQELFPQYTGQGLVWFSNKGSLHSIDLENPLLHFFYPLHLYMIIFPHVQPGLP